jgi:hypothetical protein
METQESMTHDPKSRKPRILEHELANLKEARNHTFSLLCRLPEELLANILLRAQNEIDEHEYAAERLFEWSQNVITVCRRIRSVGIRSPELWCDLQFGYSDMIDELKWFQLCRERSGNLLFHLYVSWIQTKRFIAQISAVSPRVRQVKIEVIDWAEYDMDHPTWEYDDEELLAHILSSSIWPQLERLVVSNRTGGELDITPQLLGGRSDVLTHLHLEGLCTLHSFPELSNLRRINIFSLDVEENPQALRSFLSRTPRLEMLDLNLIHTARPDWSTWIENIDSGQQVRLSYLLAVTLTGYAEPILYVLNMLPTPFYSLLVNTAVEGMTLSDQGLGTKILTRLMTRAHRRIDTMLRQSHRLSVSLRGNGHLGSETILLELYFPNSDRPYVCLELKDSSPLSVETLLEAVQLSNHRDSTTDCLDEPSFHISDLTEIRFTNYESYWAYQSDRLLTLTGYLENRMRRGDPLGVLVVDKDPLPESPEIQWLSEGAVKEVRLVDQETGAIVRTYNGAVHYVEPPITVTEDDEMRGL